ncbi:MAG: hypothetical protein DLD55_04630 [candidate division SR1 bacterium]|nr:MAG: hypothetical protein DLD55_04630 [candidate division SR1 bacterium]
MTVIASEQSKRGDPLESKLDCFASPLCRTSKLALAIGTKVVTCTMMTKGVHPPNSKDQLLFFSSSS